jgi:hypothetical protein
VPEVGTGLAVGMLIAGSDALLVALAVGLMLLSVLDDWKPLPASWRLLGHFTAAAAFVLVGFAIAAMLERPALLNQLAALAALVLAISVRFQGIVLVAVIPTAVLLKVVLDWRAGETRDRLVADLRRLWPTAVALVGGVALFVLYKEARGQSLSTGLGDYQALARLHYPLGPSAGWSVKHLAELVLALGYVPVAALIVLLWLGFVSASVSNAERCFLAVVSATAIWLLAEVGAFSATVAPFVFERYTFYLEPLLLLAFVVWLARGLPRPVIGTVVAVVVPAALLLALNLDRYVGPDTVNGVTLASLYRFSTHLPGAIGELRWFILFGVVLGAFLFALCSKTIARIALPALLAAYLVAASIPAQAQLIRASRDARSAAGIDASEAAYRTSRAIVIASSISFSRGTQAEITPKR